MTEDLLYQIGESYKNRRVMITGGLGMIGSTIAHILAPLGAQVLLVDACLEPYGANFYNIEGIREIVNVNIADIRDRQAMKVLVRDQDVVFNLAGQVSHNDSIENPFLDAEINYIGHLNILEKLRVHNPDAVILHAGSRLQYGAIRKLPVTEDHPLRPKTPYSLNKTAAENMYIYYHEVHGLKTICMRISNPYGPRCQMRHSKYSIVNFFIRRAMDDRCLSVFGDGMQLRDYVYVEDVAVAFILAGACERCFGNVYNLGSGMSTHFKDMVEAVVENVGKGRVEYIPWPEDYINVETGDFVADIEKLHEAIGWSPSTTLDDGLKKTVTFYQANGRHYF